MLRLEIPSTIFLRSILSSIQPARPTKVSTNGEVEKMSNIAAR